MSSPKAQLRAFYNEAAEDFSRTREKPWREVFSFVEEESKRLRQEKGEANPNLLDIGCGNGRHSLYALKKEFRVFSLDFSINLLRILKSYSYRKEFQPYLSNLHLIYADALSLPLKSWSMDTVLCIAVLHHLSTKKERLKALKEINRVLKREGKLLVSVWAFEQKRFKKEYLSHLEIYGEGHEKFGNVYVSWKFKKPEKIFQRFYHLFIKGEVEKLCIEAGFEVLSSFKASTNYYAICRKV